jgi:hypothetical protein
MAAETYMSEADREAVIVRLRAAANPTESAWPEPRPIVSKLPPAPEFNTGLLLPPTLASYVQDESNRMPCAQDYVGAALLVALGATIGSRAALKPKQRDDWLVVPNLWGAVVGDPSSKKSPAIEKGLRFLDRLEALEADRLSKLVVEYEAERSAFEARESAVQASMKQAAGGKTQHDPSAMRQAIEQMRSLVPPEEPVARRYRSNDATIAKLAEILVRSPDGLVVVRDELTGLLSSFDQSGHESDRSFYLEAWNGLGSFAVDRIGRGSTLIKRLTLSVFGGIQPTLLAGYLAEASRRNDGLLQRFGVLVFPEQVEWQWCDRSPKKGVREAVRDVFDRLATFDPVQDGAAPATEFLKVPSFALDDAAQGAFIEYCTDLHRSVIPGESNPLLIQHFAKCEKLVGGIALVLHLAGGGIGRVGVDSVLRACAWSQYLAGHARRVYALADVARTTAAEALARHLAAGKLQDGFTARDVVRKGWTDLSTTRGAEAALVELESCGGYVRPFDAADGAGGRPTTRYRVNPAITRMVSR